MLDRRLTWTPHVNYIKTKCNARLNILRRLTGVHWGCSMHTQLLLYKALVRSLLLYGAVAFAGVSGVNLRRLESIRTRAVTIATGALNGTRSVDLLALVGESPLKFEFLKKVYLFGLKAFYQNDSYIADSVRESWHSNYGNFTSSFTLLADLYPLRLL